MVARRARGGRRGLARARAGPDPRQRHRPGRRRRRPRTASSSRSGGCRTAKVKVAEPGQSLADEIARLEAVRDALGPSGAIRIDANAAWDVDTAVARLVVLDRAAGGLEYAEQPVPTVDDLAALRRRTHVPIAADESIRRAAGPAGGGARARRRRRGAQGAAAGRRARVPRARRGDRAARRRLVARWSRSVGLAAGIALAAALPELPYACGLATAQLLTADLVAEPLLPRRRRDRRSAAGARPRAARCAPQRRRTLADRWRRRIAAVQARA